ncbi:GNAT family N-acetyltransferase [uncultured Lutibacter sp.]|uniref:GNAT family N-acetyltransferase n=1 Tax=uncultured Lutibacter sp. TaxID=437739 RepID=UPI00261995DA|nr:GNAT family N-acetyltransferase [uncultured Lutibacter sp.]
MNIIEVREANISDAQFIAILGRVTFSENFSHFFKDSNDLLEYYNRTFSVEKIRKSIDNSNNVFCIAFVNELPVGYAKLKLNSPSEFLKSKNTSQLQKIYVLKDFLSLKIGLELQTKLIEKATRHGSQLIWLSVLKSNHRAIQFYKKMVL